MIRENFGLEDSHLIKLVSFANIIQRITSLLISKAAGVPRDTNH